MQQSLLIALIGLRQHTIGLQAVPQVDGRVAQPPRIQLSGRGDEDRLGLAVPFVSQLGRSPGDQSCVRIADLTREERGFSRFEGCQPPAPSGPGPKPRSG